MLADMQTNKPVLERAFELAGAGKCQTINDIIQALKTEGYSPGQIEGPSLKKQLRDLMKLAVPND